MKKSAATAPEKVYVNLDVPMTIAEFAEFLAVDVSWVRRRLSTLPGVIRHSRKMVRIHPRLYLEKAGTGSRRF